MDELKRYSIIAAMIAVLAGGALWIRAVSTPPEGSSKLSQLHLYVEERYMRGFDKNEFSLRYRAEPPKTIIIVVRRMPGAEKNLVASVIESAVSTVRGVARDKFDLHDIEVRIDDAEVSQLPK